MKNLLHTFAAAAALAAVMLVSSVNGMAFAQVEDTNCLTNPEIQTAIANGAIAPLADILDEAGVDARPLEPIRVCNRDGTFYYVVNVIDAYGQAQSLVLNAVDGSLS